MRGDEPGLAGTDHDNIDLVLHTPNGSAHEPATVRTPERAPAGQYNHDMDITRAHSLARGLMDAHGLREWELAIDRAKRRAGYTSHAQRVISLSGPLLELYDAEQVRLLVLHEVAHALVGEGHGHDAVWRTTCLTIGGDGRVKVDPSWPAAPPLWVGVCPNGHRFERQRRGRTGSCPRCSRAYDARYLITWTNQRTGAVFR